MKGVISVRPPYWMTQRVSDGLKKASKGLSRPKGALLVSFCCCCNLAKHISLDTSTLSEWNWFIAQKRPLCFDYSLTFPEIWTLIVNYLPTIAMALVNAFIPVFLNILAGFEQWQPMEELRTKLLRLVFLKLLSLGALIYSLYEGEGGRGRV